MARAGHLAGHRRAVRRAAGDQPPSGLREGLPRARTASTFRSTCWRRAWRVEALGEPRRAGPARRDVGWRGTLRSCSTVAPFAGADPRPPAGAGGQRDPAPGRRLNDRLARDPLTERVHHSNGYRRPLFAAIGFRRSPRCCAGRSAMTTARTRRRRRSRAETGAEQLLLSRHAGDAQGRARGDVRHLRLLPRGGRHRRRRHRHPRRTPCAARRWRADLDALYRRQPPGRREFLARRRRFRPAQGGLPRRHRRHGDGCGGGHRRARPATLDLYCDRVASAVGRLSVKVFGMEEGPGSSWPIIWAARCSSPTSCATSTKTPRIGRLYLPREYLDEAGFAVAGPQGRDRRAARSTRSAARSRRWRIDHYDEAARILAARPKGRLATPRLMGAVYSEILARRRRRAWRRRATACRCRKPRLLRIGRCATAFLG